MKKTVYIIAFLMLQSLTIMAQPDSDNPNNRQFILEDLKVKGSLGIGYDMLNSYSFGFNTFAMVENNIRILFTDTSNPGGFPTNDWQIEINSQNDGGAD